MAMGKIGIFFVYCVSIIFVVVLLLSFSPAYQIRIDTPQILLALVVVVLLALPYFNVIEVPGFLKLRKEVEEIRDETKEIKRIQMSLMQTLSLSQNAVASNVVTINPLISQVTKDASEEAETFLEEAPSVSNRDLNASLEIVKNETARIMAYVDERDYIAAFAILRSYTEGLLKDILGRDGTESSNYYRLILEARKQKLLKPSLIDSLLTIRRFANTVLHMRPSEEKNLSASEVDKIVKLGIRAIGELEAIKRARPAE